jgi:hypothetical protein
MAIFLLRRWVLGSKTVKSAAVPSVMPTDLTGFCVYKQKCVALPHSGNDKGVGFACEVELF